MSGSGGKNQQQNQHQGSLLKTAAVFTAGAVAGGLLAWFAANDDEEEAPPRNQAHKVNNRPSSVVTANSPTDVEGKDEKYGVVSICEICFTPFEEIKASGGQIMATPCGHIFCKECILQSLAIKTECPNCRGKVLKEKLRRVYL